MSDQTNPNIADIQKIESFVFNAKNSVNKREALQFLIEAKTIAISLKRKNEPIGYIKLIEIFSEISFLVDMPSEKIKLREECLSQGINALEKYKDTLDIALVLTDKLTDFLGDRYVVMPQSNTKMYFTRIKSQLDYLIEKNGVDNSATLLCRKSSLLKSLSKFQPTGALQRKMADQAFKCAEKATRVNGNAWETHLTLGIMHWHLLRYEKDDSSYNRRLEKAEMSFLTSYSLQKTIPNILTICNFYKNTYQPTPFMNFFEDYSLMNPNRREYIKQADLLSESVLQLWYGNYDESFVLEKLNEAEKLLEEAINAGFNDARMYLNLAFIKAALNEIDVGIGIIDSLYLNTDNKPWTEIAELVMQLQFKNDDLIRKGFALGIAESSSWNKLGTFAITFMQDYKLAISLYKEALKLNSNNAIVLTNLARAICSYSNKMEDLREAERLISKAASFASPKFRWWRNVREIIKDSISKLEGSEKQIITSGQKEGFKSANLSDLYKTFQRLKLHPKNRGNEFQRLISELLQITFSNSTGSYYTKPPIGSRKQIDASFSFFNKDFYRVEIKWEGNSVDLNAVVQLKSRLDIPEAKGLLISYSGFTQTAISETVQHNLKERQHILLMDGDELELIFQGNPTFDEAMRVKQNHFLKTSNPYYKIKTIEQRLD